MNARLALGVLSVLACGCIFDDTRDYYVNSFCVIAPLLEDEAMRINVRIEGNVKCRFDLSEDGKTAHLSIGGPWSDIGGGQLLSRQFLPIAQDCEAALPQAFGSSVQRMRYRGLGRLEPSGDFQAAPVEEIEVELIYDPGSKTYKPAVGDNSMGQVDCYSDSEDERVCCLPAQPANDNVLDGGASQ